MKLKFLKNSSFWSSIIAGFALIFSLSPPISQWVKNESLVMIHSNRTAINNYFGILSYGLQVDLKNDGNTIINLSSLVLEITYPNTEIKTFTAETINKYTGGQNAIVTPFTSVLIKPNEQWNNLVYFYFPIDPNMEDELNMVKFKIVEDLAEQQASIGGQRLIKAPRHLVEQAKNLFDRNFDLVKGQYIAKIKAYSKDKVVVEKTFYFLVHDFQVNANKSQTNDYKFGNGIYSPAQQVKMTWVKNNFEWRENND